MRDTKEGHNERHYQGDTDYEANEEIDMKEALKRLKQFRVEMPQPTVDEEEEKYGQKRPTPTKFPATPISAPTWYTMKPIATPKPVEVTKYVPMPTMPLPTPTRPRPTPTPSRTPTRSNYPPEPTRPPFPTRTPTPTATEQFTPSSAFTPSEMFTPSDFFTPSKTFSPSAPFTPAPSPAATATFSPSQPFTASAPFTPEPTVAPTTSEPEKKLDWLKGRKIRKRDGR